MLLVKQILKNFSGNSRRPAVNNRKFHYPQLSATLLLTVTAWVNIPTALAHKVKVDADVGATLHIEPNDNPQAGKPTTVWFALTRKGGKVIPLTECNCQFKIFQEPLQETNSPISQPKLKPISAEKYQGIPGAEVTFPAPGAYQLQLSGTPTDNAKSFSPFELNFPVTVAVSKKSQDTKAVVQENQTPASSSTAEKPEQENLPRFPMWMLIASGAIAIGAGFIFLGKIKEGRRKS